MKIARRILTTLIACVASLCFTGCVASGYSQFESFAFSDDILFTARIMGGRARYAFDAMKSVIEQIDAETSLTAEDSDLSRFNRAVVGEQTEVGERCYRIFELAAQYYTLTNGAFNPALAPLSRLWRVDALSLASGAYENAELPTPEAAEALLSQCDPLTVEAREDGGKYYLTKTEQIELDFGGVAKGYAIDECVKILDGYNVSSALLDVSGNAYFYGDYAPDGAGAAWRVGVVNPRPRRSSTRSYVCAVSVAGNNSAVTSGDYMRYYEKDGVYFPHIIGKNGVPIGVEFDGEKWINSDDFVISATVIGESSALCDALSTAVAVLGIKDGSALLQKAGCKGLIFTEKRYTIIGSELYRPDHYDGYRSYEYYEP